MFEEGFIPGFWNFITMGLFDGVKGNTHWISIIGLILVIFYIYSRISGGGSTSSGGTHYRID